MMDRRTHAIAILAALGMSAPAPAAADIYLDEPEGAEVVVSGETLAISWKTVPGEDPSGDWVILQYYWAGSSTAHYITGVADPAHIHEGSYNWTVPTVSEISYLSIEVLWTIDGGAIASSDRSLNLTVLPNTNFPSIYLTAPHPAEEEVLVIPGGSTYWIRWQVTGCNASTEDVSMSIQFSSTGMPMSYTEIGTASPCSSSSWSWSVPDMETDNAHIKLVWSDLGSSANNHPFIITADPDPNYPPVADAGPDVTVAEGATVTLDGTGTSDPNADYLTYHWERVDTWAEFNIPIAWQFSSEAEILAPAIDVASITFVFRLTVADPDGLTDTDFVNVTVTGNGPGIESVVPLEGWFKTPITISGTDLRGCGVYIGPDRVATFPDNPSYDNGGTVYLDDLPVGPAAVRVDCPSVGAITYWHTFEILRVPYQWDWGMRFHNQTVDSMPWRDLEGCFGHDAVTIPLCCEWDGVFCTRACHDPLMQLLYDYYVADIGDGGVCWGMTSAGAKYAMGALTLPPGNDLRDFGWQLEPTESTMAPIVKQHHISQVSAEVIGYLLDHTGDDPFAIAELIDTDTQAGRHGVISINNMVAGGSPLNLEGHALTADRVVRISPTEYRIYVYDPNVEEFSVCRDATDPGDYERITTQEEYPYVRVVEDASGNRRWEFEMAGGTTWSGGDRYRISTSLGDLAYYGLTYFPPEVVDGPYTAPLSLRGILMILGSNADATIADSEGRILGLNGDGELEMSIPDGVPILPTGAQTEGPGEAFVVPVGSYTTTIHGREDGEYGFGALNNGRMLAVRMVDMTDTTRDTVTLDPEAGSLELGTEDAEKGYEAVIVEIVDGDTQEDELQRTFEISGERLRSGERVRFATDGPHESLIIRNLSARGMDFTIRVQQAALGPQPEPPDVEAHSLSISGVEVPANTAVEVTPSAWNDLGQATATVSSLDSPATPDSSGCDCNTGGGPASLWWLLGLLLLVRPRRLCNRDRGARADS